MDAAQFGGRIGIYCTKDHVIPLCRFGTSDHSNIVQACNECNFLKAGYSLKQFIWILEMRVKLNMPYRSIPVDLFPVIRKNAEYLLLKQKRKEMNRLTEMNKIPGMTEPRICCVYNADEQKLIGIFSSCRVTAKFIFGTNISTKMMHRVSDSCSAKKRVKNSQLGCNVAVRFATEEYKEILNGSCFKLFDERYRKFVIGIDKSFLFTSARNPDEPSTFDHSKK